MKRLLVLAALLAGAVLAAGQKLTDAEKADGFVSLFDGKSLEGWKVSDKTPKSWKVENGLLVLTGGSSHLYTKDEFEDFIVRFEWRPAKKGYNSGFFIRGSNQIQMAQGGAGQLFGAKESKAVPQLHKEPGEWNEWEVSCIGPKVGLKVNGKLAWEVDNFKPVKGPIGIEAEGHYIDFKNIRLKKIEKK
jgi:hypothetical protein